MSPVAGSTGSALRVSTWQLMTPAWAEGHVDLVHISHGPVSDPDLTREAKLDYEK